MKIYVQMRDEKTAKPYGQFANPAAMGEALAIIGKGWADTKKGRSFKVDGSDVRLYYSDKKLAGTGYVDTVPAPAAEPDKQPMRVKVAK